MTVELYDFGKTTDGRAVMAARLTNRAGSSLTVLDYGATIQALRVPNRNGTMTDPEEIYNLEMVFRHPWLANEVMRLLVQFEIPGKMTERKGRYVVYLRDGDDISDFLRVLGANRSLLHMEDIRVVKDVRNRVNRRVNCETANIHKTAASSVRQIEDIRTIEERDGLESLPDPLKEIALVRLEYPEATLSELGDLLDPPVGKSGVNHRLRRLHEIAVGKEQET